MNIEGYLKANNIKKAHLAKKLGVPRQNMNTILKNPREETARNIAKALDMPLWMLYLISEGDALYCPHCCKPILSR